MSRYKTAAASIATQQASRANEADRAEEAEALNKRSSRHGDRNFSRRPPRNPTGPIPVGPTIRSAAASID